MGNNRVGCDSCHGTQPVKVYPATGRIYCKGCWDHVNSNRKKAGKTTHRWASAKNPNL